MANETYKLVSQVTVGSGGAVSIDFTSIPQTYTDLQIVLSGRSNYSNLTDTLYVKCNGLSTNNRSMWVIGDGLNAIASSSTAVNNFVRDINGATSTTSVFASVQIYVPNYTSSNYKSFSSDGVTETNAGGAGVRLGFTNGTWSSTAAITSISLTADGNFVEYTTAYLYGIVNTAGTDAVVPVDVLVVAGGGGAANAGAGAGGLVFQSSRPLSVGSTYSLTIGGGGNSVNVNSSGATNGGNSTFDIITANGGGQGGNGAGAGSAGGSGGGGYAGGGGAASNQGNSGGATGYGNSGANSTTNVGGSGGGAGAAGTPGGNGGIGREYWDTNGTATYYAGGGGTYNYGNGATTSGGLGGGGNGASTGGGGTANTGGGAASHVTASGGGGSGVVIIRYPSTYAAPTSTTGSPTTNTTGGYRYYRWTGNGSITF